MFVRYCREQHLTTGPWFLLDYFLITNNGRFFSLLQIIWQVLVRCHSILIVSLNYLIRTQLLILRNLILLISRKLHHVLSQSILGQKNTADLTVRKNMPESSKFLFIIRKVLLWLFQDAQENFWLVKSGLSLCK